MDLYLAEISTQVRPGLIAVVIGDGVSWHAEGGELKVADTVVLMPLPPYSPRLNAMENVWEYLRANKLSGRLWNSYDEIVRACAEVWNGLIANPDRIQSIGNRPWAWLGMGQCLSKLM
jgi:transposase